MRAGAAPLLPSSCAGPLPRPLPGGEGFFAVLPGGRLHLQHGPIDLVCQAWGEVDRAYRAAIAYFPAILPALCRELPLLRTPLPAPRPEGAVAQAMHEACRPHAAGFITPMAAVAGAVADAVLAVMVQAAALDRASVNNGGDIAFHVTPGHPLRCGLVTALADPALDGAFALRAERSGRGVATSGRACKGQGGRSFSFGIADSVTILARTAALADAAASVVANAVDLPGHPAIHRRPAAEIDPASDLGPRRVTWDVGPLTPDEIGAALGAGHRAAVELQRAGLIDGAVLALRGRIVTHLPQPDAIAA